MKDVKIKASTNLSIVSGGSAHSNTKAYRPQPHASRKWKWTPQRKRKASSKNSAYVILYNREIDEINLAIKALKGLANK